MVKENFGSWTIIDLIINFPSKKKKKKNYWFVWRLLMRGFKSSSFSGIVLLELPKWRSENYLSKVDDKTNNY